MDLVHLVNALRGGPNYTKLIGMNTYIDEYAALDAALSARELFKDTVGNTHYVMVDPLEQNNGLCVLLVKKRQ